MGFDKLRDNLADALTEASAETDDTLRAELAASGYDLDEVRKRGRDFIKAQSGRLRMARARGRHQDFLALLVRLKASGRAVASSVDKARSWLHEQLGSQVPEAAVQAFYHRLESVEDEDLETLAEDVELLQLFDQMDDNREQDEPEP